MGECQIIPALPHLTEIVNATLSSIHHYDMEVNEQSLLLEARKTRLKGVLNKAPELYSTLNHHAGHPGIEKMMDELGKIFYIL